MFYRCKIYAKKIKNIQILDKQVKNLGAILKKSFVLEKISYKFEYKY